MKSMIVETRLLSAFALVGASGAFAGALLIWFWFRRIRRSLGEELHRLQRLHSTIHDSLYINERLRRLIDLLPHSLLLVNQQGQITLANALAAATFGHTARDLVGMPLKALFAARWRVQLPERLADLFARQAGQTVEDSDLTCARRDGSEFPVEINVGPVVLERDTQLLLVIADISFRRECEDKLRRAAEELARSNEELEQFAYVVSHDLKAPLRMVRSYSDLLAQEYGRTLDDTAKTYLHYATDGARRMTSLIDDLLEYSRVGRGEDALDHRVDLGETAADVLHDLGTVLQEFNGRVTCGELPVVLGNSTQLRRLVQNLIGNALKFRGHNPPSVSIGALRLGTHWQVTIEDNGIGIPAHAHSRVFQIFARLHTQEEFPGTGLGLAICKRIVEQHQGRIWIESEVGRGTSVHFTCRAYPADVAPSDSADVNALPAAMPNSLA